MRFISIAICVLLAISIAACSSQPPAADVNAPADSANSTTGIVLKLTLKELAAAASSILLGEVTDIATYQDKSGIYNLVTLEVGQAIKGKAGQDVKIRVPGGEVRGNGLWVEDAPAFQIGERVIVFLEEHEGVLSVVGGFQGKHTIDNNDVVDGTTPLSEYIQQVKDLM
jgi:hypothetical protein